MKRSLAVILVIALLAGAGQLLADLPGGNNLYSANITVKNENGNGLAGVAVQLWVHTWYGNESDPETYDCFKNGVSGSGGAVYLECLIPAELSEGMLFMQVSMTDSRYTVFSSQNTWSNYATRIYPVLNVGLDYNDNEIVDVWEMPLAQKFCPVLFAPKEDRGLLFGGGLITLRPIPANVMDIDGPNGVPDGKLTYHDVYVEVTNLNGDPVGEWEMEDLTVAGLPYSSFYPDRVHHNHKINNFRPPGQPQGTYILHPHFEWATINLPEGNDVWYAKWEQKYNANPQNSLIRNGCTYVSFIRNGSAVTIEYRMHYPFNASAGRHEGDWPNLQVNVNLQNPTQAQIVSVSYPFHGLRTVRTNAVAYDENLAQSLYSNIYYEEGENHLLYGHKYFVINNTHPVSFAGGRIDEYGVEGWGSHAQYPLPGTWIREETIFEVDVEEYVVEHGSIPNETVRIDFNSYQNIIIIPPKSYVVAHLINNTDFNWLVFGGYWGHRVSRPTAKVGHIEIGNIAPTSPYGGTVANNEIRF